MFVSSSEATAALNWQMSSSWKTRQISLRISVHLSLLEVMKTKKADGSRTEFLKGHGGNIWVWGQRKKNKTDMYLGRKYQEWNTRMKSNLKNQTRDWKINISLAQKQQKFDIYPRAGVLNCIIKNKIPWLMKN